MNVHFLVIPLPIGSTNVFLTVVEFTFPWMFSLMSIHFPFQLHLSLFCSNFLHLSQCPFSLLSLPLPLNQFFTLQVQFLPVLSPIVLLVPSLSPPCLSLLYSLLWTQALHLPLLVSYLTYLLLLIRSLPLLNLLLSTQ